MNELYPALKGLLEALGREPRPDEPGLGLHDAFEDAPEPTWSPSTLGFGDDDDDDDDGWVKVSLGAGEEPLASLGVGARRVIQDLPRGLSLIWRGRPVLVSLSDGQLGDAPRPPEVSPSQWQRLLERVKVMLTFRTFLPGAPGAPRGLLDGERRRLNEESPHTTILEMPTIAAGGVRFVASANLAGESLDDLAPLLPEVLDDLAGTAADFERALGGSGPGLKA